VLDDRYVDLVDRGFDLAVRVGVPMDTSARARKLVDGRRCLVAAPAYVKAHGRPESPRDLSRHECLVHGEMDASMIWRFGRARGPELPVTVRGRVAASSSEAVLELVRRGLGLALLAEWIVADDIREKRLVPLLSGFPTPPAPIYLLTPPGRFMPTAVRALSEHLAAAIASRLASLTSRSR
jgi:DNA-binding transcriptional LysR family regulator